MKNYEWSIKFREWSYAESLYHSLKEHLYAWLFGKWDNETCDIWHDKGFRILGIEINKRTYLKQKER